MLTQETRSELAGVRSAYVLSSLGSFFPESVIINRIQLRSRGHSLVRVGVTGQPA